MTIYNMFAINIPMYVMLSICIVGIVVRILIRGVYKNLIRASENMANSQNNLMKHVIMRFEACYKLKIGVHNVDIFVDKHIFKHKVGGILLYTWENISGQLLTVNFVVATVSVGLAVFYECGQDVILYTFLVGLIACSLLIIVDSFLDLSGKRIILQVNMKDYLENMLQVKLEQMYFYPENLEKYQNEYFKEEDTVNDIAVTHECSNDTLDEKKNSNSVYNNEIVEEEIIATILKEYMI